MLDYFFKLHNEGRIGFKKLTRSDLGLDNNHVTHIGLLGDVLTFLPNDDVIRSGLLIYDDYCDILNFYFDRILRDGGDYNSPKIKSGNDRNNSIVVKIREIAKTDPNSNWFLIWFGLESEEVVFWLVKDGSNDYDYAKIFFYKDKAVFKKDLHLFKNLEHYLLERINFNSIEMQKDIEVKSLMGEGKNIYKPWDLEHAQQKFKEVGKKGEELVFEFLEKERRACRINSFVWENQSKESGLPYDFVIDGIRFVDVKSTRFDFDHYLFYSDQEIKFVADLKESNYSVFRVFELGNDETKMRICNNCVDFMQLAINPIIKIQNEMALHKAILQTLNVGVKPLDCFKEIESPIILKN